MAAEPSQGEADNLRPYRRSVDSQQNNERKSLRRESRKTLPNSISFTDGTLSTEMARMQLRIIDYGAARIDRQPHSILYLQELHQVSQVNDGKTTLCDDSRDILATLLTERLRYTR